MKIFKEIKSIKKDAFKNWISDEEGAETIEVGMIILGAVVLAGVIWGIYSMVKGKVKQASDQIETFTTPEM